MSLFCFVNEANFISLALGNGVNFSFYMSLRELVFIDLILEDEANFISLIL